MGQAVMQNLSDKWKVFTITAAQDVTDEMILEIAGHFEKLQKDRTFRDAKIVRILIVKSGLPLLYHGALLLPYSTKDLTAIEGTLGDMYKLHLNEEDLRLNLLQFRLQLARSVLGLTNLTANLEIPQMEIEGALKFLSKSTRKIKQLGVQSVMIVRGRSSADLSELSDGLLIFPSTAREFRFPHECGKLLGDG